MYHQTDDKTVLLFIYLLFSSMSPSKIWEFFLFFYFDKLKEVFSTNICVESTDHFKLMANICILILPQSKCRLINQK